VSSCRRVRLWILRAQDQRLPLERGFDLEVHLAVCPECQRLHAAAGELEEALASLGEPPAERLDLARSARAIRARIEEEVRASRSARRFRRVSAIAGAAAAAVLVSAFVAWWLWPSAAATARRGDVLALETEPAAPADLTGPKEPPVPRAEPRPDPDRLDPNRLETARARICEALLEAGREAPAGAASAGPALAARVDELSRPLAAAGWPVLRLVEAALEERDLDLARPAARYLGVAGDRLALQALRRALERRDLGAVVLLAFADAGEPGLEGLASALDHDHLRDRALRGILEHGGPPAARALEGWLTAPRRSGTEPAQAAAVRALAWLGPDAVDGLLRLSARGGTLRNAALDALASTAGARERVLAELRAPSGAFGLDLLLEACARLAIAEAWPRAEELAQERAHRGAALACLARLPGLDGLRSLLGLAASGRAPLDEVRAALELALEPGGERLADLARERGAAADRAALRLLVDLLVSSGDARAAPALCELAFAVLLDPGERQWAALAVGEVGAARDAERLGESFGGLGRADKVLAAAVLISIQRLAGEAGVRRALADAAPGREASDPKLFELLRRRCAGGAVSLFKIARALEPWLEANENNWRSSS
jgi:hypothetical protein